jgi:hypothetical protein
MWLDDGEDFIPSERQYDEEDLRWLSSGPLCEEGCKCPDCRPDLHTETVSPSLLALRLAHARCGRLSGREGFGEAAIALADAVIAYEATTGETWPEPERSLWLHQAELERKARRAA